MKSNEILNQEMARIYHEYGELKASIVVEESTPEDAPLHSRFEWDDEVAGHEYRKGQARRLIRIAVITNPEGEKERFVHVPKIANLNNEVKGPREGVYKPTSEVVKSVPDTALAVKELQIKIASLQRGLDEIKVAAEKDGKEENLALILAAADALGVAKESLSRVQ